MGRKNDKKDICNIPRAIELVDACSIQTWKLPSIDEYVPNDACLNSSDDDIPTKRNIMNWIELSFLTRDS